MSPDRQCQIDTHEIHRGKGLAVRLSLAVALSAIQVTVRFGSVPIPILRNNYQEGGQEPSTSLLLLTSREDLRLNEYLGSSHARICTMHLQTPMPSPGFKSRVYCTTIRIINSYTRRTFSSWYMYL
ncbi:hypothetical protein TNCV_1034281 [Trichonephila clavipes]|nr:hypothetical protein TNCV_1034281 [Trichonephila clavipes]